MKNVTNIIAERLPDGWQAREQTSPSGPRGRLKFVAPDGRQGALAVLKKKQLTPREVLMLAASDNDLPDLVVAPYLSPSVRRRLTEAGICYLDQTGNIRISLAEPGLFIEAVGADRDPNPKRRPSRSLAGAKAGQIIRALCMRKETWGVRDIAEATGSDPGYVSRLLAKLDREALIERGKRGRVEQVDWQRLIERWAQVAPIETRGTSRFCIAPRGLPTVMSLLPALKVPYAVTGSFATKRFASVAASRLMHIYVDDIDALCRELQLTETEAGINMMIIEPKDSSIISDSEIGDDGMRWAPIVQVAADLLTSQGRGPAEGVALFGWMAKNEEAWRG